MGSSRFFTARMGLRLRALRIRAGLTQDEVAARMGLAGSYRRRQVERLELARVQDPALSVIARYLQACGAKWNHLTDLLEAADPASPGLAALDRAELDPETRQEMKERVNRLTQSFLDGLPYWRQRQPVHPRRHREAGASFAKYQIVAGLIEYAVEQELKTTELSRVSYPMYMAVSRQCLGLLWRMARKTRTTGSKRQGTGSLAKGLAARETFWRKQKLDMPLARRVQQVVIERFERLTEESPELFADAGG